MLCSRSSTAKKLADCRGTGNQGAGKDSCRQMFLTPELLSTRKGKMSKVFCFFFLDLYTYSFNMNNLAYHKAAGETLTPIPLSWREEAWNDWGLSIPRCWCFLVSSSSVHLWMTALLAHGTPGCSCSAGWWWCHWLGHLGGAAGWGCLRHIHWISLLRNIIALYVWVSHTCFVSRCFGCFPSLACE